MVGDDPRSHLAARLLSPATPSAVSSDDVIDNIRRKVRKYKKLATSEGAALVVVVASEPGTSLGRDLIARTLEGKSVMSLAIDPYGSATTNGRPVKLRQTESSPTFDPALSAVGWVEVLGAPKPHLTLWPMENAKISVSRLIGEDITVEGPGPRAVR